MNGYKTATVTSGDKAVEISLTLRGDWDSNGVSREDYNLVVNMRGFETALSRAIDSNDGVGVSKNGLVTVTAHK